MKKTCVIVTCFITLCFAKRARCELFVYEYVLGEKVVYDDSTELYWYWNLADFVDMTYDEQQAEIAGLGTYGYIDGGWHMASGVEMESLWNNTSEAITSSFAPSWAEHSDPLNLWDLYAGRYDVVSLYTSQNHFYAEILQNTSTQFGTTYYRTPGLYLQGWDIDDGTRENWMGAWVVTGQEVVPLPGAVLLSGIGIVFASCKLRRRKEI